MRVPNDPSDLLSCGDVGEDGLEVLIMVAVEVKVLIMVK